MAGHRLVSGERRLRACRRGAVLDPENPHFQAIPAVICPGPLSEGERRTWQLVENLAREELQPGELAAALMFERCALLTVKLLRAGIPVSEEVNNLDDPIERFRALEKLEPARAVRPASAPRGRRSCPVLASSSGRARQMVRAFASLPPELSDQLDEEQVSLHTRMRLLALRRGRTEAADELWAAVRARRSPELLAGAVAETLEHPRLSATRGHRARPGQAGQCQPGPLRGDESPRRWQPKGEAKVPVVTHVQKETTGRRRSWPAPSKW